MRIYAGIGSRRTPPGVLVNMRRLAAGLSGLGWHLATGGADGADAAFAAGAGPRRTTIYLPWPGYNGIADGNAVVLDYQTRQAAERYAARFHPAWNRCSHGARKLHARNAAILLGPALDAPVDAVVCWTPGGQPAGGTATRIRIAEALGIPVLNLALLRPDAALERLAGIGTSRERCAHRRQKP